MVRVFQNWAVSPRNNITCVAGSTTPVMRKAPQALVFIIAGKLASLDTILPVAMELRAENSALPIEFLFFTRAQYEDILGNYFLASGLRATGKVTWLHDQKGMLGRAISAVRLLVAMMRFSRRRTVLFFYKSFEMFPYSWLGNAARIGGGARINYLTKAFPSSIAYEDAMRRLGGDGVSVRPSGEGIVVYHPRQLKYIERCGDTKVAVLGSPRSMPAWRRHLTYTLEKMGIVDLEGRRIDASGRPCLAIFYPGNHALPDLDGTTACRDQLVTSLAALRSVVPQTLVLIKPHIICDLDELKRDLRPFRDLDIRLTLAHPQAIGRVADAVLVVNGTHVMDDMFVESVPVIEASFYAKHVRDLGGSLFPNAGLIQATEESAIADALKRVLAKGRNDVQFDIADLYWPKPPSLSETIWQSGP